MKGSFVLEYYNSFVKLKDSSPKVSFNNIFVYAENFLCVPGVFLSLTGAN